MVLVTSPGRDIYIPGKGETLTLESAKYRKSFEIEYAGKISGALVLKFVNVNTINEALKLVGYHVPASPAPGQSTPAGEITGFTVLDVNGQRWGKIVNIDSSTLNKIIEVQDEEKIFYVPFTGSIVKEINEEQGIVIIDPPAGLKELNR